MPAPTAGSAMADMATAEQVADLANTVFHEFVSLSIQHLVNEIGKRIRTKLEAFEKRNDLYPIAAIRGPGAMIGFDIDKARDVLGAVPQRLLAGQIAHRPERDVVGDGGLTELEQRIEVALVEIAGGGARLEIRSGRHLQRTWLTPRTARSPKGGPSRHSREAPDRRTVPSGARRLPALPAPTSRRATLNLRVAPVAARITIVKRAQRSRPITTVTTVKEAPATAMTAGVIEEIPST